MKSKLGTLHIAKCTSLNSWTSFFYVTEDITLTLNKCMPKMCM